MRRRNKRRERNILGPNEARDCRPNAFIESRRSCVGARGRPSPGLSGERVHLHLADAGLRLGGRFDTATVRAFIREYLFVSLFRACAESLARENASRLAAMQRAAKNID